jgi:lactate dehydrogenase-like 2-hydroxyacid dehydrogenase
MANKTINLAILDDYQHLGEEYFSAALGDRVKITTFQDTLNPRNKDELPKLVERLKPFQAISTMRERTAFTPELLRQLPNLKFLLTTGMKNASLDLPTFTELGIQVVGTESRPTLPAPKPKHVAPDSTTTHCWAMILGLARHIARDDRLVKEGGWQGPTLATRTQGKTIGMVGLGRLGTSVGRIAIQAFGMKVIAWSTNLTQEKADEQAKGAGLEAGDFEVVSKEKLFKESDVVSIQLVLSDRSRGVIGKSDLELMKKSALFVNTSRGPLVDEAALLEVCEKGSISGAALDVFDLEPLAKDSKWRTTKWGEDGRADVLLSPHMGYGETQSVTNWYKDNAENLKRWLDGAEVTAKMNQL